MPQEAPSRTPSRPREVTSLGVLSHRSPSLAGVPTASAAYPIKDAGDRRDGAGPFLRWVEQQREPAQIPSASIADSVSFRSRQDSNRHAAAWLARGWMQGYPEDRVCRHVLVQRPA